MKKIPVLLFLVIFTFTLSAKQFNFYCPYESVPLSAQGKYSIDTADSEIIYTDFKSETRIDQLVHHIISSKQNFFCCNTYSVLYDTDFVQFDRNGNAYFLMGKSETGMPNSFMVIKYSPDLNEATVFIPKLTAWPRSIAVSDDGQWIFVSCTRDYDSSSWEGTPMVIAIRTTRPDAFETIYELYKDFPVANLIFNLCFDSNTKNLYFSNLGWVKEYDASFGEGLYVLRPDSDSSYNGNNLERYTNAIAFNTEKLMEYADSHNLPDYALALDELKRSCGWNLDYDNIVFSLKYFKSQSGTRFAELYKEDINGNPLVEEEAFRHLFVTEKKLFSSFLYEYSKNLNPKIHSGCLPLEYLCFEKNTGLSAWKGDRTYLTCKGSISAGYLFFNDDGVWMNYKVDDGQTYSELSLIANPDGYFLPNDERLSSIELKSIYKDTKDFIFGKDYVLFLPESNDAVYLVKGGKTENISYLFPEDTVFTKESISEARYMLSTWKIETEQTEKTEDEGESDSKIIILILSVLLGLVLLLLILLIFISYIRPSIKQALLDKDSVSRIKKDRKYVFNIQEAERGKISRDIHDSIIQDLRGIRFNAEMIKADETTENRRQLVIQSATDCVVKLRNICYNLTPAELATHIEGNDSRIELISIIQTLLTQFIEKTHVPCTLQIDEKFSYPVFDKETSQNLFRIIQEALANIEKHSYATQCSVFIKEKFKDDKKFMIIYISDDGVGCDMNKILNHRKKLHFGLQNMQERAELIGAEIKFRSEQGEGMEIIVTVPVD